MSRKSIGVSVPRLAVVLLVLVGACNRQPSVSSSEIDRKYVTERLGLAASDATSMRVLYADDGKGRDAPPGWRHVIVESTDLTVLKRWTPPAPMLSVPASTEQELLEKLASNVVPPIEATRFCTWTSGNTRFTITVSNSKDKVFFRVQEARSQ
ncbi:MAG: hypothetical protein K2Q20_12715 [Phycisphaerales bacterium]|nr:hypothetical protein [Phycisphaerales bacterium]